MLCILDSLLQVLDALGHVVETGRSSCGAHLANAFVRARMVVADQEALEGMEHLLTDEQRAQLMAAQQPMADDIASRLRPSRDPGAGPSAGSQEDEEHEQDEWRCPVCACTAHECKYDMRSIGRSTGRFMEGQNVKICGLCARWLTQLNKKYTSEGVTKTPKALRDDVKEKRQKHLGHMRAKRLRSGLH